MQLTLTQINDFQSVVWEYYRQSGRDSLPWRQPEVDGSFNPYKIMVSVLMLQQTQVSRVIPKYQQFLELFPDVNALAGAPLSAVLTAWSGLGYNRRAKFLHQAAKLVVESLNVKFPTDMAELVRLPGVGANTAGAILAYAYDRPQPFIETNIRTVYFHHFFGDREAVPDKEVTEMVIQTLDDIHPREWFWALMDYGAYLKATGIKLNMLSKSYKKQSIFQGSRRQIRGAIVRQLAHEPQTLVQLAAVLPDTRLAEVLADLQTEALITQKDQYYYLSE